MSSARIENTTCVTGDLHLEAVSDLVQVITAVWVERHDGTGRVRLKCTRRPDADSCRTLRHWMRWDGCDRAWYCPDGPGVFAKICKIARTIRFLAPGYVIEITDRGPRLLAGAWPAGWTGSAT